MMKYPVLFALAELPDAFLNEFAKAGIIGGFCVYLMWLERERRKKEDVRQTRQDARLEEQMKINRAIIEEFHKVEKSVDQLTLVNAMELASRESVSKRTREKGKAIEEQVKRKLGEQ